MSERKALIVAFDNSDRKFFEHNPARQAHIRLPHRDECAGEFWSLGDHPRTRRRILLWRIPPHNPSYDKIKNPIMKIPFLTYADENIADEDEALIPIIHTIMTEAQQ